MNINKIKKTIKSVLAVPLIRKFTNKFNFYLYKFLSISKILAIPYHVIFSHFFDREMFAFTKAVEKYNLKINHIQPSNILIRRNIHRLEKGLIMENRRSVFALDYIEETVENYALVMQNSDQVGLEIGEILWAHDVLSEYFKEVDDSNLLIQRLKVQFSNLPVPDASEQSEQFIPYESKKRAAIKIPTYEEMLNLSMHRRSVRWFEDKKVPRVDVDKALAAAILAPSACNRQPFKYRIFDDTVLTKEIANIPFGTSGYADFLPMVVVIVGDLSDYFSSRDRHTIYIDASLSAMAFMYALETLSLSSVAINWPDFGLLESKMKKKLNLKAYERPVLLIGVGYAKENGRIPYSKKKPLESLRSYNDLGE